MDFVISPANWPASIVEQIIYYVTLTNRVHFDCPEQPPTVSYTRCKARRSAIPFQAVCRNWASIIRIFLCKHMCLQVDADGHIANPTKSSNSICHYNYIEVTKAWRFIRYVTMEVSLESVVSGTFATSWNQKPPLTNVICLGIIIYMSNETNNINLDNMLAKYTKVEQFAQCVARLFPHVKAVKIYGSPALHQPQLLLIGDVYSSILKHISRARRHANNTALALRANYKVQLRSLNTFTIPPIVGLTSITLKAITTTQIGTIILLNRNAPTLQRLELVFNLPTMCASILVNEHGQPIVYPNLEWLSISVFASTQAGISTMVPGVNPFPQLRYLHLPGGQPYANNGILRCQYDALVMLSIGIENSMVESFEQLRQLKRCPHLKSVDIYNVPTSSMHRLPVVIPTNVISNKAALSAIKTALLFSKGLENLSIDIDNIDDIQTAPLLEVLNDNVRQTLNISELTIKHYMLSISNIVQLVQLLPALVNLEYQASSFDTLIDDFGQSKKSGNNQLLGLTVNSPASSCTLNEDYISMAAIYAAKLASLFNSISRIQIVSGHCASLDKHSDQLQHIYGNHTTHPAVVKFVEKTSKLDAFVLCRPQGH